MDTEFVPTPETEGKPFQVDKYGNHRIVMKGKESEWYKPKELATLEVVNKNGIVDVFIAATDYVHSGFLPTGCVLKTVLVDEDGDSDYYKFKFVDLVTDEVLDVDEVSSALSACTREQDYDVSVKASGIVDFVKIKVTALDIGREDLARVLDRDGVVDYLMSVPDPYEFDIYNEQQEVINLPNEKGGDRK